MVLRHLVCSEEQLPGNLSEREAAHVQRRVGVGDDAEGKSIQVVDDYTPQPPEPADQYQWDEKTRRWGLRPEVAEAMQRRANAAREIERLELKVQPRVIRELRLAELAGEPTIAAVLRLQQIDTDIADLRADL